MARKSPKGSSEYPKVTYHPPFDINDGAVEVVFGNGQKRIYTVNTALKLAADILRETSED